MADNDDASSCSTDSEDLNSLELAATVGSTLSTADKANNPAGKKRL